MGKKPIVKLRVYRGKQMNYNEDGSVQNENQLISVEHKSMQWRLTMKTLSIMGYCKVIVDHVLKDENGEWEQYSKGIEDYSKEVSEAYSPKSKIDKTADQLRIEQLESQNKEMMAKMEAFMSVNKVDTEEVNIESKDLLKELQEEYFLLYGKKAHHMMKEDRLIEEIDKIKNK
tara:strand:- start:845 stop:1363 length:519 start_codon:yes stop_codon:yes gene_type:complete